MGNPLFKKVLWCYIHKERSITPSNELLEIDNVSVIEARDGQ